MKRLGRLAAWHVPVGRLVRRPGRPPHQMLAYVKRLTLLTDEMRERSERSWEQSDEEEKESEVGSGTGLKDPVNRNSRWRALFGYLCAEAHHCVPSYATADGVSLPTEPRSVTITI